MAAGSLLPCSWLLQTVNLVKGNLIDLAVCGYQAYLAGFLIDTHVGRSHIMIQDFHHIVAAVIGAGQQIPLSLAVSDDGHALAEDFCAPDAMSKLIGLVKGLDAGIGAVYLSCKS